MYKTTDNIVAVATNPSGGALNIVRCSGPSIIKIYKSVTKTNLSPLPNSANVKFLYTFNKKIKFDQAVVLVFCAPKSFTGEDMVEFSVHGEQNDRNGRFSVFLSKFEHFC